MRTTDATAPEPLLIDAREAARLLRLSERTLHSHTKNGLIPAVRLGRLVRYSPDQLRAWIARQTQEPTQASQEMPAAGSARVRVTCKK